LMSLWSFQGACAIGAPNRETPALEAGLSKLSSKHVEVDVVLGELDSRTADCSPCQAEARHGAITTGRAPTG
jgi:hypothetical protein